MSIERLKELISYDPETGVFRWAVRYQRRRPGDLIGSSTKGGALAMLLGRKRYLLHRLAWLYVYGEMPDGMIDHINGDASDNRIANLRLATPAQNSWNRKLGPLNKSGFKGVAWNKAAQRWQAGIKVHGKYYYLGLFLDPAEAHAAYCEAAKKHFGEYARAA